MHGWIQLLNCIVLNVPTLVLHLLFSGDYVSGIHPSRRAFVFSAVFEGPESHSSRRVRQKMLGNWKFPLMLFYTNICTWPLPPMHHLYLKTKAFDASPFLNDAKLFKSDCCYLLMLRVDAHNGYQGKLNDLLEVNFSIMKCKVVHGVAKEG